MLIKKYCSFCGEQEPITQVSAIEGPAIIAEVLMNDYEDWSSFMHNEDIAEEQIDETDLRKIPKLYGRNPGV